MKRIRLNLVIGAGGTSVKTRLSIHNEHKSLCRGLGGLRKPDPYIYMFTKRSIYRLIMWPLFCYQDQSNF